jgi:phospholipid-binding lipoprotein MlaA
MNIKNKLALMVLLSNMIFTTTNANINDNNLEVFEEDSFDEFDEFEENNNETVNDPLYWYNERMTDVNTFLYNYLLIPVAETYDYITPDIIQTGVYNFFDNLKYPVSVTSNLLQLEFEDAWTETERFVVNSTIGIAGIFDPALDWLEIEKKNEDLGQTFGTYGIGPGFHIVIPILGPSNLRDLTGDIINWTFNPIYYNKYRAYNIISAETSLGLTLGDNISKNESNLKYYKNIISTDYNKYIELKTFYEENRKQLIKE